METREFAKNLAEMAGVVLPIGENEHEDFTFICENGTAIKIYESGYFTVRTESLVYEGWVNSIGFIRVVGREDGQHVDIVMRDLAELVIVWNGKVMGFMASRGKGE